MKNRRQPNPALRRVGVQINLLSIVKARDAFQHLVDFGGIHITPELPARAIRPAGQRIEEGAQRRQCDSPYLFGLPDVSRDNPRDDRHPKIPWTNHVQPSRNACGEASESASG